MADNSELAVEVLKVLGNEEAGSGAHVSWDPDEFCVQIVAEEGAGGTDWRVVSTHDHDTFADLVAWGDQASLNLQSGAAADLNAVVLRVRRTNLDPGFQVTVAGNAIFGPGVGPVLTSPGGSKFRLTVTDDGDLGTEPA